ncbi:PREDICTED: ATPase family AAA domain-containing protein 2-like [Polistes canadensis]|uniref:ATPase family AAA domain-containing protein 2-like n=1 Tax=Polistes canadensis TaxID=91411 RepID=UPI000718EB8D|nr:PREDICTED: ATPase family AAA domain-containing protein 2-like [Polistes canadensis]
MSVKKDFTNIGGLEKHIRIVKEMVLFPLMYGDVYAKFNLKPPRGLLFYGPPGTGKTLVASALASECSTSDRKVSFISRKGSDCLSKWVGESEKKLEKIFTMAQQTKPCIIFFDEVDGLAPIRSSRQDFVHASVVTTLLALMDGLENNSEIIVIGATNRIDAIDPALRRPGRFDRELYFPLPCYSARKDILSVHIKSWKQKPPQKFLAYLASKTIGYCGSDLQALCAEAVMCCVRRHYPEIYTLKSRHYINERHLKVEKQDFLKAQENIVPASHRVVIAPVKSLSMKIQPLLRGNLSSIQSQLQILCPTGMLTSDDIIGKANSKSTTCPRILLCGEDDSHTRHLGPALLHDLDHLPCHVLDVTTLFEETGRAAEETIIQKVKGARRTLPSLLYIPDILAWWNLVDETARVVFASLMRDLDNTVYMLILTTANSTYEDLPLEIKNSFDRSRDEVFEVPLPGLQERKSFFLQLFTNSQSDAASSRSSFGNIIDFIQIMGPKRTKTENGKKSKMDTHKDLNGQRGRLNVKRECSASGEGSGSKRAKMSCASFNISSTENITDLQLQELLQRIIQSTENWKSNRLENLYGSLELILERKNEDNTSNVIENCFQVLEEMKRKRTFFDYEDD